MLIGLDGEKIGILKTEEALTKARSLNMDLVQVSPKGNNPVVCKLLDYGKFKFEKKKNQAGSKKQKKQTTKEIKFRPSTDIGDYNIKLKKIKSFINDGDKTKIASDLEGERYLTPI